MARPICNISDCSKTVHARGWCVKHHRRWLRTGDPLGLRPARPRGGQTPEQRFWAKVTPGSDDDCWLWTGQLSKGYGRFHWDGAGGYAHRFAYELLVGPIPDGLTIDHLCRVTMCVNPGHMEPVTAAENSRRVHGTKCVHGHPFTPDNVYLWRGRRHCRTCRRERGGR